MSTHLHQHPVAADLSVQVRFNLGGEGAAVGVPKLVTADMIKDGVAIIDVGVNRIGMTDSGKAILAGDVDFESVKEKASCITPVPGGVGPLTIAMLISNTVNLAKARRPAQGAA